MNVTVGADREQGMKVVESVYRGGITREQLAEFDVLPLTAGEETVGMVMLRGPEVHVAILPLWRRRWLTRGLFEAFLGGLEEKYGYALTSCFDDEPEKIDFITRLGFRQIHAEDGMLFFERAS